MKLNKCQQNAHSKILEWFEYTKEKNFILDGAGGTGKSTLIDFILKDLKDQRILLLAPTHEALYQLKDKTKQRSNLLFKTVSSGLGISPSTNSETIKFEHRSFPKILDEISLIIVDEASMIPAWQLELFQQLNLRVLWVGHKSQLPPVESGVDLGGRPINRSLGDKCDSPVFSSNFPSVLLQEPMRNKGNLWKFTQTLEKRIYDKNINIDSSFDCSLDYIRDLVKSEEGKNLYREGKLKTVVWRNNEVISRTKAIRKNLFGEISLTNKYLPGDLVIFTSPVNVLPDPIEELTDSIIKTYEAQEIDILYNNTKATILEVETCNVELNSKLSLKCYKLLVKTSYNEITTIYEPLYEEDRKHIEDYYKFLAWGQTSQAKKNSAFAFRYFVLNCFAKLLHFYAATTYRLQGSSIEKVIVIARDLDRIPNKVERNKHWYVACSRAKGEDGLMIYRG